MTRVKGYAPLSEHLRYISTNITTFSLNLAKLFQILIKCIYIYYKKVFPYLKVKCRDIKLLKIHFHSFDPTLNKQKLSSKLWVQFYINCSNSRLSLRQIRRLFESKLPIYFQHKTK